jgi:ATP-dependent RNA helicase DDX49/DBP8
MNDKVKLLSSKAMKEMDSVFIFDACNLYQTADKLEQSYLFMPKTVKDCYLYELIRSVLEKKKHSLVMIFFSSIQDCEILMLICQQMNIKCDSLHAGKSQRDRLEVLKLFRKRRINCLFCTDVGNRGLDIPSVTMVINYDLPDSSEKYVLKFFFDNF